MFNIELKVDSRHSPLQQMKQKEYHEKYMHDGNPIYLVGINFDSSEKNITDYEIETV